MLIIKKYIPKTIVYILRNIKIIEIFKYMGENLYIFYF